MKRITEIFTCDICGAETEITEESKTHRFLCPARLCFMDEDDNWIKSEAWVEMCPDCYNAYFALFDQHFATIRKYSKYSYGNITVTKKFKTEDPFTINEPEEFNNASNT